MMKLINKIYKLDIELHNTCNLNCGFCPNSIFEKPKKRIDMEDELLEKIYNIIKKNKNIMTVSMHLYNQPFLSKEDVVKMKQTIKKIKEIREEITIRIANNLTKSFELDFKDLIDINADEYLLTTYRKKDPDINDILTAFKKIGFVLTKEIKENWFSGYYILNKNKQTKIIYYKNLVDYENETITEEKIEELNFNTRGGIFKNPSIDIIKNSMNKCNQYTPTIRYNGEVSPCCELVFTKPIGNLNTETFEEIFEKEEVKNFYKTKEIYLPNECLSCKSFKKNKNYKRLL
jgi:radical SAM protein with 4Fe4S-binding SPASM domain